MDGDLVQAASRAIGRDVCAIAFIGGGANSRVYRIETSDGERLALKWYFRDDRDRGRVEFQSLQFLCAHGVRSVPRPVAVDLLAGFAVYELIEGEPAMADGLGAGDIAAALTFVTKLRDLSRRPDTGALPAASEACFCLRDLRANLERRAARLDETDDDTDASRALHAFLQQHLRPAMVAALDQSEELLRRAGMGTDAELTVAGRTLSPSDFGFHNAIRRATGLVFVDFEYFGWDDPAKLAADFLLHPAMSLPDALKRQFLSGVRECFAADGQFLVRVAAFYPLFALKWCLIVLNEFLPGQLQRRRFAVQPVSSPHDVQMGQLAKAQKILAAAGATPLLM
jgi:hypothetical protein